MVEFKCARQQLSLETFEAKLDALVKKYSKAENYLKVIYDDRVRWAEYVSLLAFSVGSWTTLRVKGIFRVPCRRPALFSAGPCLSCSEYLYNTRVLVVKHTVSGTLLASCATRVTLQVRV